MTVPVVTHHKFTVAEYYQMAEAGILSAQDRVELINGEIIEMAPIGPPHNARLTWLNSVFGRTFLDVALIQLQGPVHLNDYSDPQPDLALIRRRPGYERGHPTPEDIFLIMEVADTSVRYDRDVKSGVYAQAGIIEYWMFDVNEQAIMVFRDPGPDSYRTSFVVRRGDRIALIAFPDRELAVDDLLGDG